MGAGFLWVSLICLGVDYAHNLKRRVTLFEETKLLIGHMKIEIEFLQLPVYDLLCKISISGQYKDFDFISECCELVKRGTDFPAAWKTAVDNSSMKYKTQEKSKLLLLGENLGKSDLKGQLTHLDIYYSYFDEFAKQAKNKMKKYAGLTPTLGFLSGFMLFILLI